MVSESDVFQYANATSARRRIPRLIHQIWRTDNVPLRWNATFHSVLAQNTGDFKHYLWTDVKMDRFVCEHEPEFYKNTYINYPYDIQRVDSFRYVVLYHLGGIYIDLDNGCNRPFKDLLATLETLDPESTHLAAFPRDNFSISVESDFLISTVGHPFYKQLISRLYLFNHHFILHFWTVQLSTGPIYVSLQERLFSSSPQRDTVRILDYKVVQPMFVWKVIGREWVGKDAPFLFYISAHSNLILLYWKIFTVFLVVLILIKRCKTRAMMMSNCPQLQQVKILTSTKKLLTKLGTLSMSRVTV